MAGLETDSLQRRCGIWQSRCVADSQPPCPEASEIAAAFELGSAGGAATLVATTLTSRVWQMETSQGRWAVKESLRPRRPERDDEVLAIELAAVAAGVPTPEPVISRATGRSSAHVRTNAGAESEVRVWPWRELAEIDSATPVHNIDQVGSALAAIHRLSHVPVVELPALHPYYWQPPDDSTWDELAARAENTDWTLSQILSRSLRNLKALGGIARAHAPSEVRAWCHLDVTRKNWVAGPTADLVVIDWDDAGLADPCRELGQALVTFCRPDESARRLVASYAAAGGPGRCDDLGVVAGIACVAANTAAMVIPAALTPERTDETISAASRVLDRTPSASALRAVVTAAISS